MRSDSMLDVEDYKRLTTAPERSVAAWRKALASGETNIGRYYDWRAAEDAQFAIKQIQKIADDRYEWQQKYFALLDGVIQYEIIAANGEDEFGFNLYTPAYGKTFVGNFDSVRNAAGYAVELAFDEKKSAKITLL